MEVFSQIIFPVFGMIIILFAIGTFFFPYGAKIKDKIQKIGLLGISLEISIVTAIILTGLLFCGIGFYLNEHSYKQKLDQVQAESTEKQAKLSKIEDQKEELNNLLTAFKNQSITYYFVLDDINENTAPPPAEKLSCIFYKNWREKSDSMVYKVKTGSNGYKVTFNNLSIEEFFDASPVVYLVNKESRQRWVASSFNPLSPTLYLQPEQ